MSKLELMSMAEEFKLNIKGWSIWWLDVIVETKGLKEIHYDVNALSNALSVDSCREMYIAIGL